ncbi:MAG: ABC transporter permease [Clostridiaceae bacterium]|nr:ABC transporter permease [Clostridiaceae bacterium]
MRSLNDIAYKYIGVHKKRSVLTISGITIAVTLLMSVGTLVVSLNNTYIQNAIKNCGDFEAGFSSVDKSTLKKIEEDDVFSNFSVVSNLSNLKLTNTADTLVVLKSYDESAFRKIPISLQKGSLPMKSNEILLEDNALKYFGNPKIGVKIKLNLIGEDNSDTTYISNLSKMEFVLCGIVKAQSYSDNESNIQVIFRNSPLTENVNYNIYFNINSKNNFDNILENIAKKYNIDSKNITYNYELISLRGKAKGPNKNNVNSIITILMLVVTITSILIIYNIFNISVLERIRHYGILRALGANKKQIKKIVLKEGFILGLISIPLGIFMGYMLALLTIQLLGRTMISDLNNIIITIDPKIIILCFVLSFVTIFLSVLGPSKKAAKVSPVEAITNNRAVEDIEMKKINYRLIRRLLGVEGEIAFKNIQRNKGRCLITISSLVITFVLFIVISTFNFYVQQVDSRSEWVIFDYKVMREGNFNESILNEIKAQKFIDKVNIIKNTTCGSLVPKSKLNVKYFDHEGGLPPKEFDYNGVKYAALPGASAILAYDTEEINECKKYLIQGKISIDDLTKERGVVLYFSDKVHDLTLGKDFNERIADIKLGDEIILDVNTNYPICYGDKNISEGYKVKVLAILNDMPSIDAINQPSSINLITTDDVFTDIKHQEGIDSVGVKLKKTANKEDSINFFKNLMSKDPSISLMNFGDMAREVEQERYTKKTFLYSFVITILIMGILNISNTITTNIILRNKEFATLKAIGMNQRSIRNIILIEGVIYVLISVIVGTTLGIPISHFINSSFSDMKEMSHTIPITQIFLCSIVILIITMCTVILSSRRLKNINITDCLKNEE